MIPQPLLDAIHHGQSFLIFSHVNPDGDAVGSLLGMSQILSAMGKRVTLAMQDLPDQELATIPGVSAIRGPNDLAFLTSQHYDAIISTDASSVDRLGALYNQHNWEAPLLVIDHHITNTRFGTVNWVEPGDAATCQMLVRLADALAVPLELPLSQLLLTGLVTDTLCFRTSNTTPSVLETGMRLLSSGASLTAITENILDQRPISVLHLWGHVLGDVQMEDGVIWVTVTLAQLQEAGDQTRNDGSLSSLLIRTDGASISASFIEKIGEAGEKAVECSFRARSGFDISSVALQLGGGGHPAAGGATVPGTLPEVAPRIVAMLKQARDVQARK